MSTALQPSVPQEAVQGTQVQIHRHLEVHPVAGVVAALDGDVVAPRRSPTVVDPYGCLARITLWRPTFLRHALRCRPIPTRLYVCSHNMHVPVEVDLATGAYFPARMDAVLDPRAAVKREDTGSPDLAPPPGPIGQRRPGRL